MKHAVSKTLLFTVIVAGVAWAEPAQAVDTSAAVPTDPQILAQLQRGGLADILLDRSGSGRDRQGDARESIRGGARDRLSDVFSGDRNRDEGLENLRRDQDSRDRPADIQDGFDECLEERDRDDRNECFEDLREDNREDRGSSDRSLERDLPVDVQDGFDECLEERDRDDRRECFEDLREDNREERDAIRPSLYRISLRISE